MPLRARADLSSATPSSEAQAACRSRATPRYNETSSRKSSEPSRTPTRRLAKPPDQVHSEQEAGSVRLRLDVAGVRWCGLWVDSAWPESAASVPRSG